MLEVRRDGEGVLVAVVVQRVVQAHAFGGEEAVAVEEGGRGLQGGRLAPAQDVVENESQQAVVSPLAPFKQQDLAGSEEHHPTCRMLRSEDSARDDVVPGRLEQPLGRRSFAVVLRPVRPERKGIFVFPVRVVGAEDEKLRRAVSDAGGVEHGNLVPVVPAVAPTSRIVQGVVRGLEIVTERGEEQAEPVALQLDAGLVPSFTGEVVPELDVRPGEVAQGLVGRPFAVRALGGGLAPAGGCRLDVVGEELGQVNGGCRTRSRSGYR